MSTRQTPPPSAIARHVANATWPGVQTSDKLAKGIYWFTCVGHGGAVAALGEADLPDANVEAARTTGRLELVAITPWKGKRYYSTAARYTRESLERWARRHDFPTVEVWVGEEDCDWAQIAYCSAEMREAMRTKLGCSRISERDCFDSLRRWNERYLRALDPNYEFDPDGLVMKPTIARERCTPILRDNER
jgi:hypothetical protein